jgi:hypothetical protein
MKEFYLTQTSLKDLERQETCPWRWKEQWLEGTIPFKSNEMMDKGKYFEQLILGSGAISGDEVNDLPRLKNGEKSAEHLRIDAQAERCKRMLFDEKDPEYLGFSVIATQLEVKVGNRKGTYDIHAWDQESWDWVIDLKLTSDLTSDRTQYGWGNDWASLDLVQITHYQDLFLQKFGKRPRMGLLVMDYSTQKRAMFGEICISENKLREKENRFKMAENVIDLYKTNGWVKIPNVKECEACPLKCDMRIDESKLIKKVINY